MLDGDSTFCLDLGFYNTPTLQLGADACNAIEDESCGLLTQLPIYASDDPTWNVAVASLQVGDDVTEFSGRAIFDTTKAEAIFPRAIAQAVAANIATLGGLSTVTETYVDGCEYIAKAIFKSELRTRDWSNVKRMRPSISSLFLFVINNRLRSQLAAWHIYNGHYVYNFTNNTEITAPLLINFSSSDPATSDLAKFFEVPVANYLVVTNGSEVTLNFFGSSDSCVIGISEGYKMYIGTLFMTGNYFGFHPGYVTIVQQETIAEVIAKRAQGLPAVDNQVAVAEEEAFPYL